MQGTAPDVTEDAEGVSEGAPNSQPKKSRKSNPKRLVSGAALVGAATALSACGGGGGGGGGGSSGGGSSGGGGGVTFNYTDTEAVRFLLQAQFSASPADVTSLKTLGYAGWLNANYSAPSGRNGTQWLDSQTHGTPKGDGNYFNPTMGDWMAWNQLMTGADQMRRRLTLALSEMMVTSLSPIDGFWPPYVIAGYWDMLLANVYGNFRTLIEEVTLNPSMGFYLNTKGNLKEDPATGRQPDENYAREIMQLFTIGLYDLNQDGTLVLDNNGNPKESYVQSDITNLARVFTGYDWNFSRVTYLNTAFLPYPIPSTDFARDRMSFDANKHSRLEVRFLNVVIPAETPGSECLRIALDGLFNHPNVGPFFARQMIQRLVTSNPSPAYVGRVAAAFNNNGSGVRGDLKAVWTAILTDTEARTVPTSPTQGKLREPIVRWTQWARTFKANSASGKWEIYDTSNGDWGLGQSPLRSPSVFNYFRPGYVPPQTALAVSGDVAPEFQLHNETTTAGYLNFMQVVIDGGYGDTRGDYAVLLPLVSNAKALLDWLNLYMSANQISAETIALMQTALEATVVTDASSNGLKLSRIHGAILMVMSCPEYLIQK